MKRFLKLFNLSMRKICKYNRLNYDTKTYSTKNKKRIHPYRIIHPWTSTESFSQYLVDNVIYNKGGLVAINKPYGISVSYQEHDSKNIVYKNANKVANPVLYTIEQSLNFIARKLGYSTLKIVKSPEKYMSGVTLLVANDKVEKDVIKSYFRAKSNGILPTVYWIVTTKTPKELRGRKKLALKLQESFCKTKKSPIIIDTWSKNEQKRQDVKVFFVEFNLLSNSTGNLSSLIEIKVSTRKWHTIRLFASSVLHSPVLGDNIYGSLIQKVMGAYINVGPFSEVKDQPPTLKKELLDLLHLDRRTQDIIPVHIHLRKICLVGYSMKEDLTIEAPLMPEFKWTCQQLQFKHEVEDSIMKPKYEYNLDFHHDFEEMENKIHVLNVK